MASAPTGRRPDTRAHKGAPRRKTISELAETLAPKGDRPTLETCFQKPKHLLQPGPLYRHRGRGLE